MGRKMRWMIIGKTKGKGKHQKERERKRGNMPIAELITPKLCNGSNRNHGTRTSYWRNSVIALRCRCPSPFGDLLLVQGIRLAHHGVLTRHTPSESALDLGPEGELVQVIRLFVRGDEALFLQRFVLEALQPFGPLADICHAAVAIYEGGGVCVVGEHRRAAAYGREPLRIALGVYL